MSIWKVIIRLNLESAKITPKMVCFSKSSHSNWPRPSWEATFCYQSDHCLVSFMDTQPFVIHCVLGRGVLILLLYIFAAQVCSHPCSNTLVLSKQIQWCHKYCVVEGGSKTIELVRCHTFSNRTSTEFLKATSNNLKLYKN